MIFIVIKTIPIIYFIVSISNDLKRPLFKYISIPKRTIPKKRLSFTSVSFLIINKEIIFSFQIPDA